jgi:hypothetical protein
VSQLRWTLSVAAAAGALKISKTSARRLFDAARGAAGALDATTGERRFDPAWVAAEAERRAGRPTRIVATTLSVAEAAARLGVGKNTVRRWFDRDRPESGTVIQGGRTGGTERRCAEAWVRAVEQVLEARPTAPQ